MSSQKKAMFLSFQCISTYWEKNMPVSKMASFYVPSSLSPQILGPAKVRILPHLKHHI